MRTTFFLKAALMSFIFTSVGLLTACHTVEGTVRGAGQDIQEVSNAVSPPKHQRQRKTSTTTTTTNTTDTTTGQTTTQQTTTTPSGQTTTTTSTGTGTAY